MAPRACKAGAAAGANEGVRGREAPFLLPLLLLHAAGPGM